LRAAVSGLARAAMGGSAMAEPELGPYGGAIPSENDSPATARNFSRFSVRHLRSESDGPKHAFPAIEGEHSPRWEIAKSSSLFAASGRDWRLHDLPPRARRRSRAEASTWTLVMREREPNRTREPFDAWVRNREIACAQERFSIGLEGVRDKERRAHYRPANFCRCRSALSNLAAC